MWCKTLYVIQFDVSLTPFALDVLINISCVCFQNLYGNEKKWKICINKTFSTFFHKYRYQHLENNHQQKYL